ncbi:MAG: hypothetical protein AMXMBFR84_42340 [Candidatus Hydrogenedentota bacterium]
MQASPTYNLHTRKNRLPSNLPIYAHRRSSADKTPRRTHTSAQSLFSTGFWQTADIDDIRFTGSNLKTTTTFTYDDWGRMTQKANSGFTADYAYRYEDSLFSLQSDFPEEQDVSCEYGGNLSRRIKVDDSSTTQYRFAIDNLIVNEEDESGVLQRTYVGRTYASSIGTMPASGEWEFYTLDHLLTVRSGFSGDKTLSSRYEYTPFGSPLLSTYSATGCHVFSSNRLDKVNKLMFSRSRVYSPSGVRWMTRDMAGMIDTPNLYTYVRMQPVSFIDTEGFFAFPALSIVGGLVGCGVGAYMGFVSDALERGPGSTMATRSKSAFCNCIGGGISGMSLGMGFIGNALFGGMGGMAACLCQGRSAQCCALTSAASGGLAGLGGLGFSTRTLALGGSANTAASMSSIGAGVGGGFGSALGCFCPDS